MYVLELCSSIHLLRCMYSDVLTHDIHVLMYCNPPADTSPPPWLYVGVQSWVASLTEAISNSLGVTQHPTANTGSATRSSAGGEGTDDTDSPATLPTGRRK